MAQDVRALPRNDQLFLGLGALVFIASFLPWYGATASVGPLSESTSTHAWHGLAAFGIVLMLVATVLVGVQLLSDATLPQLRVSWNVVVVALDAVGALIVVIKSFDLPSGSVLNVSYGLRWGGWILILAAVAQVVVAGLRFRDSGEPLPWAAGSSPPAPPAA